MADQMQFIRVGMRRNGASVKLKLRWDNSPRTCELVGAALPIEGDMWHAKYANHEIYILLPVVEIFGEDPPGEWQCMYPAPGDLMYLFHPPGLLPKNVYSPDSPRQIVDVAYFYDRGNNLYGPSGANPGNIFATAVSIEDMENFAKVCLEVWKNGFSGERMYVEPA